LRWEGAALGGLAANGQERGTKDSAQSCGALHTWAL